MEKDSEDNFLFVSSDFIKKDMLTALDKSIIQYTRGIFFKTV